MNEEEKRLEEREQNISDEQENLEALSDEEPLCDQAHEEHIEVSVDETETTPCGNVDNAAHSSDLIAELEAIKETQAELKEGLERLSDLFQKRIMYVEYEQKIVGNMHRELQTYKDDLYFKMICPILEDIITVANNISRMSAKYLEKPDGEQAIPNSKFAEYVLDLHDILEKNDIEIYKSNDGKEPEPIKQKIIEKIITKETELKGKIAKSYSYGYMHKGKVISAEKVAIYINE